MNDIFKDIIKTKEDGWYKVCKDSPTRCVVEIQVIKKDGTKVRKTIPYKDVRDFEGTVVEKCINPNKYKGGN
jgi:hypothetical protein